MPRINLEPKIWSDPRFQKLMLKLGDRHRAIGVVVDLWTIAQSYWLPEQKPIPKETFHGADLPMALVEVGLVEETAEGFYAKGSHEHFQWWFEGLEQRRTAGKSSAKRPRDAKGRLLPKLQKEPTESNGPLVNVQRESNGIQPSSSSSSSSVVDSASDPSVPSSVISFNKQSKNTYAPKAQVSDLFDFESVYNAYPRKKGKTRGMSVVRRTVKTPEDFAQVKIAIENFIEYHRKAKTGAQYVPYFSSFMSEWRDWVNPEAIQDQGFDAPKEPNWDYIFDNDVKAQNEPA